MFEKDRSIKEFECMKNNIGNEGINAILESLSKNTKL
jgi:hypothetical protein